VTALDPYELGDVVFAVIRVVIEGTVHALYKAGSIALTAAAFVLAGAVVALDYQKAALPTRSSLIDHNENSILSGTIGSTTATPSVVPGLGVSRSYWSDSSATKPNRATTKTRSKRIVKTGADGRYKLAENGLWQLSDGSSLAAQPSPPRGERKSEDQNIRHARTAGIALYLWLLAGTAQRATPGE
jgi:hypothetical protein